MKDFDCYGSTVLEILCEINDGHPPATELALDRVAPRQGGLKASQLVDHNSIIGPALGRARGMRARCSLSVRMKQLHSRFEIGRLGFDHVAERRDVDAHGGSSGDAGGSECEAP